MKPVLSYLICTSPRSGSTFLCNTLAQTGIAGRPEEYFVTGHRDEFLRNAQLGIRDHRQYLDGVIRASTTANGVFGMKLHAVQTPYLMSRIGEWQGKTFTSLRDALEAAFPNLHYILLTRRNKVAQAVSYYRAIMTNEWWRYSEQVPKYDEMVPFDQYGIKKALQLVEMSDSYWERYFREHRISPLRLVYEDMVPDYENAVRGILRYLGLPDHVDIAAPATKKMANERSKAWEEEFIALEKKDPAIPTPAKRWGAPL